MTANSLFPAFVKIDYHSAFGLHSMTVPTKDWSVTPNTNGSGAFSNWSSGFVDADDMVNELVDLIAPFYKPDTTFDQYTVYIMDSPEAAPVPVAAKALGTVGSNVGSSWSKAVQTTFSFRTDNFKLMKLVLLDAPSGNQFDAVRQFSTSPEAIAIKDALADSGNGWTARGGGQVTTLVQVAYTLNEKLRHEYRMN